MAPRIESALEAAPDVWKRRLVWTLSIVGGVLFSLWAISAAVDLTIWGASNHYIGTLSNRLGISMYLANALSFTFVVPFFVGVKYYLFSVRDRRRKQRIGLTLLLSMGVAYNIALYLGTRDAFFDDKGRPARFYALVPGGVVFSDRPGTELKYGVPFRPVDKENIKRLLRIQQGRIEAVNDPARHDWFDRVTGDPLLWYSGDAENGFYFFDGPGHDPATRAELKPVTPEIRQRWQQWQKKNRAVADEADTIVVDLATYGTSCRAATGNDTSNLAAQCNGRQHCSYRISNERPGGDPTPGCNKDYVAQYHCSSNPLDLRRVFHEPIQNEGYSVFLNCGAVAPNRATISDGSTSHWDGTVDNSAATLDLDPDGTNGDLSGKITYQGVIEDLAGSLDAGGNLVLRGKDYRRAGGNGSFALDTFYGQVSAEGKRIVGSFSDTRGDRGPWEVTKTNDRADFVGGVAAAIRQPTPELSDLDVRPTDPHTCEKSDEAYYGNWGPERAAPAGSGQLRNPEFLFDNRHEDRAATINWANGFRGTLPVCFVVDDKGNPTEIRFLQSPGTVIEEHVKTKIAGWRYKPGTITQNWLDSPRPVAVQVAFDFVFN